MLPVWLSFMLLSLANIGTSYVEKDFNCESTDFRIPTISVCDGVLDCANASDNVSGVDHSDESEEICAPAPYLEDGLRFVTQTATNTTFEFVWIGAKEKIANYSLELAGYFVTGKSQAHSFQKTLSRHLSGYKLHGLRPRTHYTVILRAFYTESGKPESSYKIGRAASVDVMTLASGTSFEEKDFNCESTDFRIPTISVCDGVLDCANASDNVGGVDHSDESEEICAPAPYLEDGLNLLLQRATSTTVKFLWNSAKEKIANYSLELAGYFVTGKSQTHSFQKMVSRHLSWYKLYGLRPWTHYTVILRAFYTESGKPESSYKIGRAASVDVMTLHSAPEVPSMVSVLYALQRHVVLSIVGPSSWNSDVFAFHVRWVPSILGRGLPGERYVYNHEWSPEENAVIVTLPLQGGWDYRVFVSAVGVAPSGHELEGPEQEVEVSVPLDSYEISVYGIRSNSAVLSWRSSLPADLFNVTVAKVSSDGATHTSHRYQYKGTTKASWSPAIAITGLEPWSYYVAILEGCFEGACNESVNTTFITAPSDKPMPTVTRIAATGAFSFEIAWTLPQSDRRLYEGFRVQYCTGSYENGRCFVADTKEKSFTAFDLKMCSRYYVGVSVQYRNPHGVLVSGPPARASIVTWCAEPLLTVTYHGDIDDGSRTSLFAWTCVNSSVETFEYRLDGRGDWTPCDDSADCDVVVDGASTEARSSGYLRLTHHRENQNFVVGIRGCDWIRCGKENTMQLNVHSPAPLTTPIVNVTYDFFGAQLMCDQLPKHHHRGLEILWKCTRLDDHHHMKRLQRQNSNYGRKDTCQTDFPDVPLYEQGCEFTAAQYEQSGGETYYGPRVKVLLN